MKNNNRLFDPAQRRLIIEGQPATNHMWDNLWQQEKNLEQLLTSGGRDKLVQTTTRKFLHPAKNVKVLDGGCGNGQHVAALTDLGYDAYGIDYAPRVIDRIKKIRPELKVSTGDVRHMPFPDNFFDGYWSLGVIEHLWNGYEDITTEMARVIKNDGFLFLVFPHMSLLRQTKAKLGLYDTIVTGRYDPAHFYEFALNEASVIDQLASLRFSLLHKKLNNGFKGFKDESGPLQQPLQRIYDSQALALRIFKVILSRTLNPLTNHTILLVFQKQQRLRQVSAS